jgi:mono/diheme cytochrome c family protein
MSIRKLAFVALVASTAAASACSSDAETPPVEPTTATYYQDVKPILDAKCVACHTDGGIAPFSLRDFASAAAHAASSAAAVEQKQMPPWPASSDCRDYVGDRSLDDAQIATIKRWADLGAPDGDPAAPGAPLEVSIPTLSRVDRRLEMPEAYTLNPPPGQHDDYRCFVIPWPAEYKQKTYVTGFRAVPGNSALVHHVSALLAGPSQVAQLHSKDAVEPGPGYTCLGFGDAGAPVQGMLGGWAPGSLGSDLPPGVGFPVEPGSAIVLQVHYHGHAGTSADRSAIELKIDATAEREGRWVPFVNPQWPQGNMPIPAGDPDVVHEFTADPTPLYGEVEIFVAALHMHTLGTSGTLRLQRADGTKACLLQIDDWSIHWQGLYDFTRPEVVRRGDSLSLGCRYDNSAANQPIVGGQLRAPMDVNWGDGTEDEMCVGFFLTAPAP